MQNNLYLLFITFNLLALNPPIKAQTDYGAISGTVTDVETGETLPFVNVAIEIDGELVGAATHFDGIYLIDSIPEATYEVYFSYVGYQTKKFEGLVVSERDTILLDVKLNYAEEIIVPVYSSPIYYDSPLFNSLDARSGIVVRRYGQGRNDFRQSNIR